jgi:hypothetical protein
MTRGALLAVGRYDGDLAERFGGFDQAGETLGEDTIVVGAQKYHR